MRRAVALLLAALTVGCAASAPRQEATPASPTPTPAPALPPLDVRVASAPAPVVLAVANATPESPAFRRVVSPQGVADDAGEPSVAVDLRTGAVLYQANLETLRVDLANGSWKEVAPLATTLHSEDPILALDPATGRVFVSQLMVDCSILAWSDDDGADWTTNPLGCGAGTGFDHQTVGGGRDAVYYCSHDTITTSCAVSRNGGLTFLPAVPVNTKLVCDPTGPGHIRVGADGTAYLPERGCHGMKDQGFAMTTDGGRSWTQRFLQGVGSQGESDSSVALDAADRLYFCFEGGDGRAGIATTTDRGQTWSTPVDLGAAFGIQNTQFEVAVAGAAGKAACAFLGTTTPGDDQSASFDGTWRLYVAFTWDAGARWTTVDATPDDVVQQGCIYLFGNGGPPCRNLYDFMDAAMLPDGRVIVGYADGDVDGQRATKGAIAEQVAGPGLA